MVILCHEIPYTVRYLKVYNGKTFIEYVPHCSGHCEGRNDLWVSGLSLQSTLSISQNGLDEKCCNLSKISFYNWKQTRILNSRKMLDLDLDLIKVSNCLLALSHVSTILFELGKKSIVIELFGLRSQV